MPRLTQSVTEQDHTQGPSDAPLTLVEYGDYQCPSCGQAYPVVKAVQERLGDRLRFVYRNFPLTTIHRYAQAAAEAAEVAGTMGAFWPMHDTLYENQGALGEEDLVQYAVSAGLDAAEFRRGLTEHTQAERVRTDFVSGIRSGVNGTPTFFINGERYDGGWSDHSLLAALEAAAG